MIEMNNEEWRNEIFENIQIQGSGTKPVAASA